jgi:hypothetical protein
MIADGRSWKIRKENKKAKGCSKARDLVVANLATCLPLTAKKDNQLRKKGIRREGWAEMR